MPLMQKKSHRGIKALVLMALAAGGAAAFSGKDLRRYIRMRTM